MRDLDDDPDTEAMTLAGLALLIAVGVASLIGGWLFAHFYTVFFG